MSFFSGKKTATPYTPVPTSAPVLRDTSLRSVIFGKKDFAMTPYSGQQVTVVDQVDIYTWDAYLCVLLKMAQLARLCYCDAGIIRAALISPEFASTNPLTNKPVNDLITRLDAQYKNDRYAPSTAPGSIEGRPPQSYIGVYGSSGTDTVPFARYISSPSDVTFMFVKGSKLRCSFFKPDDVVLVFKGSSTMKNYKHDLYAQAKGYTELSAAFPEIPANPNRINAMPRGFVAPLQKNFHHIKQGIAEFKPRRLFITGQSLGGAYATICAFVLSQMKPAGVESIHLVSFGSPTVFGDGARNTFNEALDSGYITLDRGVSHFGKYLDPISHVPIGFSHPGFQPLKTELYPELKTGRAYHLSTLGKVFVKQRGGLLGIGKEKTAYEVATKTHMPNRLMVPVLTKLWSTFPHGEYMEMTYAGVQRLPGLKNPGFKNHTFIAEFSDAGLTFKYVDAKPGDMPVDDAQPGDPSFASVGAAAPQNAATAAAPAESVGGTRKQRKQRRKTRKGNRKVR